MTWTENLSISNFSKYGVKNLNEWLVESSTHHEHSNVYKLLDDKTNNNCQLKDNYLNDMNVIFHAERLQQDFLHVRGTVSRRCLCSKAEKRPVAVAGQILDGRQEAYGQPLFDACS